MSRLLTAEEAENFQRLLADYTLNDLVLGRFRSSNFAVIAGPAGAGKDTLRDGLISTYPDSYLPILSTTTRPPRPGEEDGVTYHFREIEEVQAGILNREYFQAELVHSQQISCLHVAEVVKLGEQQYGLSILITETERKLRRIKPDIKTIFLIPPSHELLIERLKHQRTLTDEEVNRRLQAARNEIAQALDSPEYYCLISDTVPHVVERANDFLQNDQRVELDDAAAREVMRQIMLEL